MEILALAIFFVLISLALVVYAIDRKVERMNRIMEQERPIFLALKVQEGIKKALKKAQTDVDFYKTMEQGYKNDN